MRRPFNSTAPYPADTPAEKYREEGKERGEEGAVGQRMRGWRPRRGRRWNPRLASAPAPYCPPPSRSLYDLLARLQGMCRACHMCISAHGTTVSRSSCWTNNRLSSSRPPCRQRCGPFAQARTRPALERYPPPKADCMRALVTACVQTAI